MLQSEAIQKLHGDEGLAVLIVNLMNGADVRMIERRSGPGFALKTAESLRVLRAVVRQELESNQAPELDVFSFVDHPHSATAKSFDDAIVRDGLPEHQGQILRRRIGQVNE